MIHQDLKQLLDFAIQKGEITEKDKEILHRKAITLGQDTDELDMLIEAEVHKLKKSNEPEKQVNFACPNCGSSIPKSSIKCGFCGYEISKASITGRNELNKLNEAIAKLDEEHSSQKHSVDWKGNQEGDPSGVILARKKADLISTFTMPNDKEHLLEFFHFCDTNADAYFQQSFIKVGFQTITNNPGAKALSDAYAGKAKLAYVKLKRFVNEDDEIKYIVESYKVKYHVDSQNMKQSSINKTQNSNGEAVLFGLNKNGVILGAVLLIGCFPLCWLPFVIPQFKADVK
jgi:hypothetical protein